MHLCSAELLDIEKYCVQWLIPEQKYLEGNFFPDTFVRELGFFGRIPTAEGVFEFCSIAYVNKCSVCLLPNWDWILGVKDSNICQQLSICLQADSLPYTDLNIFKSTIREISHEQMASPFTLWGGLSTWDLLILFRYKQMNSLTFCTMPLTARITDRVNHEYFVLQRSGVCVSPRNSYFVGSGEMQV